MKIKKTILTAMFATSFLIGSSAQAVSPACNQAWDDLIALLGQYGSYNVTVGGELVPVSKLTAEGRLLIAEAQAQVTLHCESSTIGGH